MLTPMGAPASAGAVAATNSGPMVKSGRDDASMKTWAAASAGPPRRAAASAMPPHTRGMGVIVQFEAP